MSEQFEELRERNHRRRGKPPTVAGLIILFGVLATVGLIYKAATEEPQLVTPQELRTERIGNGFAADGSHRELVQIVKRGLHNPDSFQHVQTSYRDLGDSLEVTMQYRARNVFNALVLSEVKAKTTLDGEVLQIRGDDQ